MRSGSPAVTPGTFFFLSFAHVAVGVKPKGCLRSGPPVGLCGENPFVLCVRLRIAVGKDGKLW